MRTQVRLLHVEDQEDQRLVVTRLLGSLKTFSFATTCVESEDEAVDAFRNGGADLVILDYHLRRGNGLSCLKRIRQISVDVPVIAVSGKATMPMVGELLEAGADDYIGKQGEFAEALRASVHEILARAQGLKKHAPPAEPGEAEGLMKLLRRAVAALTAGMGPGLLRDLDEIEAEVRRLGLSPSQMNRSFETICDQVDAHRSKGSPPASLVARPIFLDLFFRLDNRLEVRD
jgi:CheY-like chemotaxis protein